MYKYIIGLFILLFILLFCLFIYFIYYYISDSKIDNDNNNNNDNNIKLLNKQQLYEKLMKDFNKIFPDRNRNS
jgi:hypothetical protein